MGCSAAKNLTVEPLDGNNVNLTNGHNNVRKVSIPVSVNDVPPIEGVDPQVEELGAPTVVNNLQKGANGLSFDLAFEEDNTDSIIKKHPPKRFQKLEEQQTSPVTLVKLQEKLEEAEIRRQQILQQRVQSAKYRNGLRKETSASSFDTESDYLKLPEEVPKTTNPYDVSYL